MPVITRLIEIVAESTAPTLTSPTGTSTGTTTATGTVTTNEGTGTLYYLASANAAELAATVISSGQSQAVSASGVQNVSLTGLTPASVYYLHYVHRDAASNDSARVSSSSFSTSTSGTVITRLIEIVSAGDTTAPTLTSPTATAAGPTTASGTVSTNEGNGTLFRLASANAAELASTVIASGQSQAVSGTGVQNVTFTGLVASTQYYAHYVHRDAANNASARVTSAQFTTSEATGGGVITRLIAITPRAETISSISGSTAGSTITVTTGGVYNLYTNAPTLTYGGVALTSITVTGASTFTAVMPGDGLEPYSDNAFVLTVNGRQSDVSEPFEPALGQAEEFTVAFAEFSPDSFLLDDEIVDAAEDIVVGDWLEAAPLTSGTTLTPGGYVVNIDGEGNLWLTDPEGEEGNLDLESEGVEIEIALWDASDSYARTAMTVVYSPSAPAGTLTLGTPVVTPETATLPFTWTGVNATGFEYRIDGGSWGAIGASPIALTGLTAATGYDYDVRPVNGSTPGDVVSSSFTTSAATDTTPDQFTLNPATADSLSTRVWSNWVTVTGVSAGQNIAVSVSGDASAQWQYSTDGGVTPSAAYALASGASSTPYVRLNYLVRVSVVSSDDYDTVLSAQLTIGGVSDYYTLTTGEDNVDPAVVLNGLATMTWPLGPTWVDPGATATDNVDGTLTATADTAPNVNAAGPYTITYTATDAAGNSGQAVRVVTVVATGDTPPYPYRRTVTWEGDATPAVVLGDTFRQRVTLNSDGEAYSLSSASRVEACVVSYDHSARYNAIVELAPEADWASGIVTLLLDGDSTSEIAEYVSVEGFAWVEMQISVGTEKYTWFGAVKLVPGFIP